MSQNISLRKRWQQMLEQRDFSTIKQYDDSGLLPSLTADDRELLALLMASHGEKLLVHDYSSGSYYLRRALEIAPESQKILLLSGKTYGQLLHHEESLENALEIFGRAAALDQRSPYVYHQWGLTLMHLGRLKSNLLLLQDADTLFSRAESLTDGKADSLFPSIYWSWGQLWHSIARLSGEPCDLDKTLHLYRKVAQRDFKAPQFWNDYANALWEMSGLLKKPEIFNEIVAIYRKSIQLNPRYFPAQFNLGICFQRYFEAIPKSDFFWNAHEQYTQCRALNPQHGPLHVVWGRLLLLQAQIKRDSDLLDQACDQFERAKTLGEDHPQLDLDLAEAYLWSGAIYENLSFLRQAEEKIKGVIATNSLSAEGWSSLGHCYTEYGHYFNDENYYRQALQHFTQAISCDSVSSRMWYGRALAAMALSDFDHNPEILQIAINSFERTVEFESPFLPQFWNDWGVILMKLADLTQDIGVLRKAIEKLEKAIEWDLFLSDGESLDPEWLYNYGCAYDLLGDLTEDPLHYEQSIFLLQKVIEIDSSYLQARYNLAVAYAHLGELNADVDHLTSSCEQFGLLLAADGEDEMAWNEWGLALVNLALLVYEESDPKETNRYLSEAEEKLQYAAALGYDVSFYNLACLYSLKGDYNMAINYLERADQDEVLPPIEDVMQDAWLDGLRQTEQFQKLLPHLINKYGEKDSEP